MVSLKGRWALVTGSSRGIGRQIASGLAKQGCNLIIHGRTIEHCAKTVALLSPLGVSVRTVSGDLAQATGQQELLAGITQSPPIDILYNNAAIMSTWMPITEQTEEEWARTFQVNLFAVVRICAAVVPGMKKRGFGRIINLTSGIRETPHLAPYGASKAAIDKYSQELAHDCKDANVLVNYLDPGWLRTDLGGPNGMFAVETVLPGALVPALLEDNGPTGRFFSAQDFKYLT